VTILRKKFSAAVALSFPSFKCEFWFPNFDLKLSCTRCRNSTVTTGLCCDDRMTVVGAVARKEGEERYVIAKGRVSTLSQRQSCHELLRDSGVAEADSPPARGGEGVGVMEPESENHDLVHVEASSTPKTETDTDIAPLIRKVGAPSIAEIEKLIGELQETKNFLQSEADRIERETACYLKLTQMASASVKIIFDTVSGWRQAGHPIGELVITRSRAEESTRD
jgi:hypothetical protein